MTDMNPDDAAAPGCVSLPEGPVNDPLAHLESAMAGVRRYQAVTAALDLGLFDLLKKPMTGEECAAALGCSPDLTRLLCECLTAESLLEKDGDTYRTGRVASTYFIRDSPVCQHHAIIFRRLIAGLWGDLARIIREGPVEFEREMMFRDVIIPSMAEHCQCGLLQKVTGLVAAIPEFPLAERLLDIGGGHGLYSIALCEKNPRLEATVFDLPPVTQATRDFIERYRAERVRVRPGDFFVDSLGTGYDIVFSSSNPGGKVPDLIPKIAAALKDGGLFINKQDLDENEVDPWLNLEWSLWTFRGVKKKPTRYVFSNSVPYQEYNRRLADHGFVVREVIPVDGQSAMTIAQKTLG